jgi:leucyl-tRNA synthetase
MNDVLKWVVEVTIVFELVVWIIGSLLPYFVTWNVIMKICHYYTEIRWLSCHKVSRSFFDLRNEINLFLEIKEQNVSNIKRTRRILVLAFMVNITKHLNELNLNLQRKNKLITSIYDNVKAFQTKLRRGKVNLKLVICCILKLVNPYLCYMNCNYWLVTNHKKFKTWYEKLRKDSAILKTMNLNFLCSQGCLLSM